VSQNAVSAQHVKTWSSRCRTNDHSCSVETVSVLDTCQLCVVVHTHAHSLIISFFLFVPVHA